MEFALSRTTEEAMSAKTVVITAKHVARTIYCFGRQLLLLAFEVWAVLFFMQALRRRRCDSEHPWVTGLDADGEEVWPRNIVYRSPSRMPDTTEESDAAIVTSIGKFLRAMVRRSAQAEELPHGSKRRMPHGVNYIHGAVHYNGAFLLFDDFADLVSHLTDRRFRRDLLRFGRRQRREVTLVFRNRKYCPVDFAYMVGSVRAHLPWFSNGNGPTKRPVLWGNMSPYPAINLINGAWMTDLWRFCRGADVARPTIDSRAHFTGDYFGRRKEFTFTDRLLAWYMFMDVKARGFRGQIFFTNRHRIEPRRVGEYREAGGYWKWVACHEVPFPRRLAASTSTPLFAPRVSVVVPTLNEAANIGACVDAARDQLGAAEVLVVDAGSSDDTVQVARRHGAKVLTDQGGGRGVQCRAGAAVARGEVLVFLHADCEVDEGAGPALHDAMAAGHRIAMFRQRSASTRLRYRLLDHATHLDSICTRFGDQGIIVTRDFYDELGGMPATALFEDVHLLRKARRRGPIPRIDAKLLVSPRRFEKNGVARQLAKDAWLLSRYYVGSSTARLYESYYQPEERCFATA